jgi:hypothetical protein
MPTQAKPGTLPSTDIKPEVKSWIDNVIVPVLVREYLASEQERNEALQFDAHVVLCSDIKDSREGG